jgi:integrase
VVWEIFLGRQKREIGSKVLDKTFPEPVGRIRKRTGLVTKDQVERLKSCLQELWSQGRTDELILYRDGKIDSSRVVRLVEFRESIDPDEEFLNQPLFPTLEEWMEGWYTNPRTRKTNQSYFRRCRDQTKGSPLVRDIPKVLDSYKRVCLKTGVRNPFRGIRLITGTFIHTQMTRGMDSDLYREWKKVKKWTPMEEQRKSRKNSKNPFRSPSQLDKYFYDLGVPNEVRDWISFLCLTGVHWREIEEGLKVETDPDHLRVFGTKTIGRYDRMVPLVFKLPSTDYNHFKLVPWLKKMDGRSPYDCRRTFSVWCQRSGIPQNHISTYMGHSVGLTQTTQYQREEVRNWIGEDTKLLREWVRTEISNPVDLSVPVIPVSSFDQLGDTQQHLTLNEVRGELDKVLESWFKNGFMRRQYRLREGCFEEVVEG